MKDIKIAKIRFPEMYLKTRDAHKLRGFFGNLFKEHSSLLHNHYQNGDFKYEYPKVQYKVIENIPTLVGIGEGATLLTELFLRINHVNIENKEFEVNSKDIGFVNYTCGYSKELIDYKFATLWLALNQKNYRVYKSYDERDKSSFLQKVLIGHILNFYSSISLKLKDHERLFSKVNVSERSTKFKGYKMIAFKGSFSVNAFLPMNIGLGRSVSRGFGTIKGN